MKWWIVLEFITTRFVVIHDAECRDDLTKRYPNPPNSLTNFSRISDCQAWTLRSNTAARLPSILNISIACQWTTRAAQSGAKAEEAFNELSGKTRRQALGLMTVQQLVEQGSKVLPRMTDYLNEMTRMDAARGRIVHEADGIVKDWRKLDKATLEHHITWLTTQVDQLKELGKQNYLQAMM